MFFLIYWWTLFEVEHNDYFLKLKNPTYKYMERIFTTLLLYSDKSEFMCLCCNYSIILSWSLSFWVFIGLPHCYFRSRIFLSVLWIYVNVLIFLSGLIFLLLYNEDYFKFSDILSTRRFHWEIKCMSWCPVLLSFVCCICLSMKIFLDLQFWCRFALCTLEWEMRSDCYLVLMHS